MFPPQKAVHRSLGEIGESIGNILIASDDEVGRL